MTTNDNYKWAKNAFNNHVASHKCKPRECETRLELWNEMMRVAGDLGKEGK